ncbi:hypothetical protein VB735_19735 [Halotia wernerae UHCC 0503]|nr:hypothetical protein [Halotia wernerae UHCC 0503]
MSLDNAPYLRVSLRLPLRPSAFKFPPQNLLGVIFHEKHISIQTIYFSLRSNNVLTNAHCVVNPETRKVSQAIAFLPNLVNGVLRNNNDVAYAT